MLAILPTEGGIVMYDPDCGNCEHFNDCVMRKALKSARETIFNINREKSGRKDFIVDGKLIPPEEE